MGNADQTDWNGTLAISFSNKNSKVFHLYSARLLSQGLIAKVKYRATMKVRKKGTNTGLMKNPGSRVFFLYS